MHDTWFAILKNKESNKAELSRAIRHLRDVHVSPEFWKSIASDAELSAFHRAHAILELFKRTVHNNMLLTELADIIGMPNWLNEENIRLIDALKGELLVGWDISHAVIAISIFPENPQCAFIVYLRISGKISSDGFIAILKKDSASKSLLDLRVAEHAFSSLQSLSDSGDYDDPSSSLSENR